MAKLKLPTIWWYNTTYHSTTKLTPFERRNHQVTEAPPFPSKMKALADKMRSFREFAVGDMVFVRLQPYIQMSLKGHSYHKLSPKHFASFRVLKRIGSVAYQLQLPPHAKIHSTFHVSQCKKHVGSNQ
ncbi:hypothetical protein A4A49_53023 [Nicotiana attenuata]|uniref:Tf2-1-like SH3-like domain-containing protein n=1 Tax=Nicotiana attenuata TaxID=49451 RepID=A0A314KX62_NICAT|nr:hypothetical protein A4A49_53023 [Nicotiana attenuata]